MVEELFHYQIIRLVDPIVASIQVYYHQLQRALQSPFFLADLLPDFLYLIEFICWFLLWRAVFRRSWQSESVFLISLMSLMCYLIYFGVLFIFQFLYLLLVFELDSGGRRRFDMPAALFALLVIDHWLLAGVDKFGFVILICFL